MMKKYEEPLRQVIRPKKMILKIETKDGQKVSKGRNLYCYSVLSHGEKIIVRIIQLVVCKVIIPQIHISNHVLFPHLQSMAYLYIVES